MTGLKVVVAVTVAPLVLLRLAVGMAVILPVLVMAAVYQLVFDDQPCDVDDLVWRLVFWPLGRG